MSDILCLYYSRTGKTKKTMKIISEKLSAELVEYTDGINRKGVIGYIKTCFNQIFNKKIKIEDIKTSKNLKNYDTVIIGLPIWVEDCSIAGKALLNKYKNQFPQNVYFVVTHMTNKVYYENKIAKLNNILNEESKGFISLCSEESIDINKIENFCKTIEKNKGTY